MTLRLITGTALAWLLTTGLAHSQGQPLFGKESATHFVGVVNSGDVKAQEQQRQQKMYEDIEIMRRLLDRTLRNLPGIASNQGSGFAFVDVDGDGQPDLFITNADGSSNLVIALSDGTLRKSSPPTDLTIPIQPARFTDLAAAFLQGQHGHAKMELANAEGVYLKGQGVVYSVTLPVHFWRPAEKVATPTRKPLTDWERTRKELIGEKVAPEEKSAKHQETSLADRLLKLLADNGRHFSQLTGNESLTVAVTLRTESGQCVSCHQASIKTPSTQSATERGLQWLARQQTSSTKPQSNQPDSGTVALAQAVDHAVQLAGNRADDRISKAKAEIQKQVLMGDLHMKQGQPSEAVEAYRKAASLHIETVKVQFQQAQAAGKTDAPNLMADLEYVGLGVKLAQALVAVGKSQEAEKIMEGLMLSSAFRAIGRKPGTNPPDAVPKIDLPSKLIVSAPKALLDQMGNGKITFEEFKKAATVQYVAFPAAKNDPPKPASPPAAEKKGY